MLPPELEAKDAKGAVAPILPTVICPLVVVKVKPYAVPVALISLRLILPEALVIVRLAPDTNRPLVTVTLADPVAVTSPARMVEPEVVNITGFAKDEAAAIFILPLCDMPPKVTPLKVLPNKANLAAVMSKVLAPTSLEPPTLITLVVVVGFKLRVPVPAMEAVQPISLPMKLKAPMPLKAEVMEMVPVPAFNVSAFPAPAIVAELAKVMLELLVLELIVVSASKTTDVSASPRVIAAEDA